MLSEMLGHLERQPLNKERRVAWLTLIGPVFDAMGLFLLAHFRRLFSLFFQWMHTDDDKTALLVRKMFEFLISIKRKYYNTSSHFCSYQIMSPIYGYGIC